MLYYTIVQTNQLNNMNYIDNALDIKDFEDFLRVTELYHYYNGKMEKPFTSNYKWQTRIDFGNTTIDSHTPGTVENENSVRTVEFFCPIYNSGLGGPQTPHFGVYEKVMQKISEKHFPHYENYTCLRIATNLLMPSPLKTNEKIHNIPHLDCMDCPSLTVLLYLNYSDGDTVIFKESSPKLKGKTTLTEKTRVSPKPNRIAFYDGNYHASSTPMYHDYRLVLAMIFAEI